MDRRAGLIALAAAACHAPAPPTTVVARGTLGYGVCFARDRLVTIELGERFALVVRDVDGRGELGRVDLGPPEHDWPALACEGTRAYAGGASGTVDAIDLEKLRIDDSWPIGAPVTALAAAHGLVAIGDATGAVCLRRADGALLQCVAAHDAAVDTLRVDGDTLTSRAGSEAYGWTLPALAVRPAGAPDALRALGRRVLRGAALVVEMAGAVHAIAISPHGTIAVAAWITRLDQASVVLIRSR